MPRLVPLKVPKLTSASAVAICRELVSRESLPSHTVEAVVPRMTASVLPVLLRPVPLVTWPAPLNCVKTSAVVPSTIGSSVVST